MAKLALAIGVSDYEPGLTPLPGATRDVEAMRRVLQHPDLGGFDDIKTLSNPDPQEMQEAIETLFSGRTKDDLVLLFFSGHGVKDDSGKLHLATRITRKTLQGDLIRATAVPTRFVQDIMSNSRSKRQVVILDCCFSGAFAEGWLAKDDGSVDVKSQLGGEGRAVLTSSSSTQYSFEQEGSDLSTYTRYLVEGIETGAADLDRDGVVSIDELHEYAKAKIQEAAPAMKPEIYAIKEGYKIYLFQAPTIDPKQSYRKVVENFASRGVISFVGRKALVTQRDRLGLSPEVAAAIEDEVLKPHQDRQKHLQEYDQAFEAAIQSERSLSSHTRKELKLYQQFLKLKDEDIAIVEAKYSPPEKVFQPSDEPAGGIQAQTPFRSEDVVPVKPTNEAGAASQAETLPTRYRLPRMPVTSVRVLRNPKLLIGVVSTTAVALTFIFLVKIQQPRQKLQPTSIASSTVSSTAQMSAENLVDRGNDRYEKKDYQGAIEDYDRAIQLKPNYVEAYIDRGWAKGDSGDNQGAISDYTKAIELNPSYADAYNGRGDAKSNLGDNQGAIADYQKAAELYQKQGKTTDYQDALEQVKNLQ
jgi:tetratricopeptide (TPR) repeat protein